MNGLFLTQSKSIKMFYRLMLQLREPLDLERIGFLVSYYPYYRQFVRETPDIESGNYFLLKEWEITSKVRSSTPNLEIISQYEKKLGNPYLWTPLVSDRRVILGRKSTYFQDYKSRFSHTQMLHLLEHGISMMEQLFDNVNPHFVASFICVTYVEYLAYLIAKSRGIPFLNLRPTRIKNYVTYGESIFEPSERIRATYEKYMSDGIDHDYGREACDYLDFSEREHALYEGVSVTPVEPAKPASLLFRLAYIPIPFVRSLKSLIMRWRDNVSDNHDPGIFKPFLYKRILQPLRERAINWSLRRHYVTEDELSGTGYVFFALHTEPENTLLVFGKAYLNQIEVIRNIAHNVPVSMTVIVKEHPNAVGKRPLSYYKKILDIPNVKLADPSVSAKTLILNANLVSTISGSVGWEAILRKKPVLTFGHTPYEFLPTSMVKRVTDLEMLGAEIDDLIRNHSYNAEAVKSYVAAIMSQSVAVNLYSTLLGRSNVYNSDSLTVNTEASWQRDIEDLARYTVKSLGDLE